jgi:periplasmic protein TonB
VIVDRPDAEEEKQLRAQSRENIHEGGDLVTLNTDERYRVQGWVVSALFHSLALTVALGLMAQVKPVVPKEPFKWDVALVEPQRIQETRQAEVNPTQEPAKPIPRPVAPTPSQPKMVTQEVQTPEVTPVVQREIRQVVETSQPIEETVAVQTRTEVVSQIQEQQAESAFVESSSSMVAQAEQTAPAESVAQESTPQVVMAPRSTPAVKVDHGWLAESLKRRLAELKRYPSTARLNGWEGKVVLRAVIRADGHLSEVKVHRSSGYEALDNAAMEAIRLACPLHMQQPLGTSEVAVYVPIVYSLAG